MAYDLPLDKNEATFFTFPIFLFALVHAVTTFTQRKKKHIPSLSLFSCFVLSVMCLLSVSYQAGPQNLIGSEISHIYFIY